MTKITTRVHCQRCGLATLVKLALLAMIHTRLSARSVPASVLTRFPGRRTRDVRSMLLPKMIEGRDRLAARWDHCQRQNFMCRDRRTTATAVAQLILFTRLRWPSCKFLLASCLTL